MKNLSDSDICAALARAVINAIIDRGTGESGISFEDVFPFVQNECEALKLDICPANIESIVRTEGSGWF